MAKGVCQAVFRRPRRVIFLCPSCLTPDNHIRHEVDTPPINAIGFRVWWSRELPDGFGACKCGWSGLPHYHLRRTHEAGHGVGSFANTGEPAPTLLLISAASAVSFGVV